MSETGPPRDIVHFQLAVLDAYERLLVSCGWDEAQLNDALKSMISSALPLLRAQQALSKELLAAHHEMLRQYRQALEASLRQYDGRSRGAL